MKIKYDIDVAYEHGIRKVPRTQIENRGYEIIRQLSEAEFIVEDKNRADYHSQIVGCLEKYLKIKQIIEYRESDVNLDAPVGIHKSMSDAYVQIREVFKDGKDG